MEAALRRLVLALLLLVVAACGSERPGSDYYVATFEPRQSALTPDARATLDRAAAAGKHGSPREIAIRYYVRADGVDRELADARARAVAAALDRAGLGKLLHAVPLAVDAGTFAQMGDGVVVQILRGESPPPPASSPQQPATEE